MAGKSRASFAKRQREIDRVKKNDEKRARRAERTELRGEESEPPEVTEEELFEQFRILNERKAAGAIDEEAFEEQKAELFEQLGVEL